MLAEQRPQAPRDLDLPAVRPRRVHARVEHGEVGVGRVIGERGDAERGVEQPPGVVEDQRGLAGETALELMNASPSRGP